ncbi:MAG: zf-HC2 domain-containing protein [Bryobacteraceae bacterium]|nr:zf-HC2 domain-containing protein [Bryobacteraceae bacterium]
MKCHEAEDLVWEYLDGALDQERRAAFEQHSANCAACAGALAASRSLDSVLASQFEPPRTPDSLVARTIEHARRDTVLPMRNTYWLAWLDVAGFASLAAAGLLAARVFLQIFGLPGPPSGPMLALAATAGGAAVAFWAALTVAFDFRLSVR